MTPVIQLAICYALSKPWLVVTVVMQTLANELTLYGLNTLGFLSA